MSSFYVRILLVGRLEWRGILRSHPFRLFLPAAALVVVGAPSFVLFAFEQSAAISVQVGLSTAVFVALLLGLMGGAASLPRDRERGVEDLLLSRSLPPGSLVLGKWLGITSATALAVLALGATHVVATFFRGGPPRGYAPILAALFLALVQGGLGAAAALAFSARLRPAPALAAGLLLVLAGHVASMLAGTPAADALRHALPLSTALNLSSEAAFGPLTPALWLLPALHAALYTAALLAMAAALVGLRRAGT